MEKLNHLLEQYHSSFSQLFDALRGNGYLDLQYLPARRSFFGLFKELENFGNLLSLQL